MIWKSYKFGDKRYAIQPVDELVWHESSCIKACAIVGIPTLYYRHWKKLIGKVDDLKSTEEFVLHNTTCVACKLL
jgi:hypothetical protein